MRTNAGTDHQSRVLLDSASTGTGAYAASSYIAITENSTAPAVTDTALTGELTAFGLGRSIGTYAHTNGTNTATLTKTFTSSDATARVIAKAGLLNAATVGTLTFSTAVPSPPSLVSGDSMAITWTFTF